MLAGPLPQPGWDAWASESSTPLPGQQGKGGGAGAWVLPSTARPCPGSRGRRPAWGSARLTPGGSEGASRPRLSPATCTVTKSKLPWQLRSHSCWLQDPAPAELPAPHPSRSHGWAGGGRAAWRSHLLKEPGEAQTGQQNNVRRKLPHGSLFPLSLVGYRSRHGHREAAEDATLSGDCPPPRGWRPARGDPRGSSSPPHTMRMRHDNLLLPLAASRLTIASEKSAVRSGTHGRSQ